MLPRLDVSNTAWPCHHSSLNITCLSVMQQVQYSLLSAGPAQSAIKSAADDLGVTLIAYSPLALGLLTGKYSSSNLPQGPRGSLFRQLLPGIAPVINTLEVIAKSRRKTMSQVRYDGGSSNRRHRYSAAASSLTQLRRVFPTTLHQEAASNPADLSSSKVTPMFTAINVCWCIVALCLQVAINWCICKGTIPIPGAKDLQQAQENLGALGWRLSSGEVAELDSAAARCNKQMVQNIFQTQ